MCFSENPHRFMKAKMNFNCFDFMVKVKCLGEGEA